MSKEQFPFLVEAVAADSVRCLLEPRQGSGCFRIPISSFNLSKLTLFRNEYMPHRTKLVSKRQTSITSRNHIANAEGHARRRKKSSMLYKLVNAGTHRMKVTVRSRIGTVRRDKDGTRNDCEMPKRQKLEDSKGHKVGESGSVSKRWAR